MKKRLFWYKLMTRNLISTHGTCMLLISRVQRLTEYHEGDANLKITEDHWEVLEPHVTVNCCSVNKRSQVIADLFASFCERPWSDLTPHTTWVCRQQGNWRLVFTSKKVRRWRCAAFISRDCFIIRSARVSPSAALECVHFTLAVIQYSIFSWNFTKDTHFSF